MAEQYKELPELLPQTFIERAMRLGTAALADGMEGAGILRNGCMEPEMMPVDISMRMAGTAATVATGEGDNFPIHLAIYQSKPGYVLVVDGKGYRGSAYMGDLMIGASKAIGLCGVVLDGYTRDRKGIIEIGLPVFSRGFMQKSPSKKGPGEINTEITCAGVVVCPGDLVVGDYDGIVVVPRHAIEQVLDKAEKKLVYEKKRVEIISEFEKCRIEGLPLPDIAPQWVLDMMDKTDSV